MPTLDNTIMYAMYVIGEVESNWNWAAVNRSDPITIGMMQNYGQRAANCISKCAETDPDGYATFKSSAPNLCAAVEAGYSWDWWTGYYINDAEANAWQTWAQRDENHQGQQALWESDAQGYITTLGGYGVSLTNPQTLVYAMCMFHQSPQQCGRVLQSCGGSATLANMHATCLNDSVLGQYKNRYNTAYSRLAAWDGESAPPDFGQVGDVGAGEGGQAPGITQPNSTVSRVQLDNGIITIWGEGIFENGLCCYKSAPNVWLPCQSKTGESNPGGNTGGGSETGSQAAQDILSWLNEHLGAFAYSQGAGRLDPIASGYSDCSALLWYVYHIITGINVGTWTGEMVGLGQQVAIGSGNVPLDQMQPADLVLVNWDGYNSTYDHVDIYAGGNTAYGHGGPDNGPKFYQDATARWASAHDWMVRRYL